MASRSKKSEASRPAEHELLEAIVEIADDGFASRAALAARLPKFGRRDLTKACGRLASRGLVLERRAPDGGTYLALTGEGWRALRGAAEAPAQADRQASQ
jgi:hypothetical protein